MDYDMEEEAMGEEKPELSRNIRKTRKEKTPTEKVKQRKYQKIKNRNRK